MAKRYARALFDAARERDQLDQGLVELRESIEALARQGLLSLLVSPKMPATQKREVVRGLLGSVSGLVGSFVSLVVEKGRVAELPQVVVEYERLLNDLRGIQVAEVTTAIDLAEAEKSLVVRRLEQLTGKQIRLQTKVDPAIIGGLVARLGDRVIDGSTRTRLAALRKSLAGAER